MSTERKNELRNVMALAWQFVKLKGFTMAEALKCAWRNIKLKASLYKGIVKFYFQKVDGTIREAYGTLRNDLVAPIKGNDNRAKNNSVQVYYDCEKQSYRCFKKANLI